MDRVKIKEAAKEKIKGNKWNIIWPALIISVVAGLLERLVGGTPTFTTDANGYMVMEPMSAKVMVAIYIIGLIVGIVTSCYKKYILNFVRNGKFDTNDIINCVKEKWVDLLVASILVYVIVFLCTLLFVVPGIIMGFAYAMVTYIIIDSDTKGSDSLKKSREMMKGYKWNYFVFYLSFLGWILLTPFTLGILLVWLYPYMTVADAIYYDELKKLKK